MQVRERYHFVLQSRKGTVICDTTEQLAGAYVIFHSLCTGMRNGLPTISMHEIGRNQDGSGYSKLIESRTYHKCPRTARILCTTIKGKA